MWTPRAAGNTSSRSTTLPSVAEGGRGEHDPAVMADALRGLPQQKLPSALGGQGAPAESVEAIELDFKPYTFLYESGDTLTFMDKETFDQIEIAKDFIWRGGILMMSFLICLLVTASKCSQIARRCQPSTKLSGSTIPQRFLMKSNRCRNISSSVTSS